MTEQRLCWTRQNGSHNKLVFSFKFKGGLRLVGVRRFFNGNPGIPKGRDAERCPEPLVLNVDIELEERFREGRERDHQG